MGNAESLRLEEMYKSGLTWPTFDSDIQRTEIWEEQKKKELWFLRKEVIQKGKQKRTPQTKGRVKDELWQFSRSERQIYK